MTDTELRLAIDQAWHHVKMSTADSLYKEAKEHLSVLREEQARRCRSTENAALDVPKPAPPASTTRKESEG